MTLVVVCVICVYACLVLVDGIEPFLVNLYDAFDVTLLRAVITTGMINALGAGCSSTQAA